jgi:hypothetical protein
MEGGNGFSGLRRASSPEQGRRSRSAKRLGGMTTTYYEGYNYYNSVSKLQSPLLGMIVMKT